MGEILSQAEVEAILSAIQPSSSAGRVAPVAKDEPGADGWERHDVTKPEALHGVALKVVHALLQGICGRWQIRLQNLLQLPVAVRSVDACHSAVEKFLAGVPKLSVICHVSHHRSSAASLLVWDGNLVLTLLSRMLGGSDNPSGFNARSMTNIELRLLGRLNEATLQELSALLDDDLSVANVLRDAGELPEHISKFPCVWFSVEIALNEARGLIHVGIPALSLQAQGTLDRPALPELMSVDSVPAGVKQVSVCVRANLASLKIRASELAQLQVGDLMMTDLSPSQSVSLELDGKSLSQATIGTHLGRKALRLTESTHRSP